MFAKMPTVSHPVLKSTYNISPVFKDLYSVCPLLNSVSGSNPNFQAVQYCIRESKRDKITFGYIISGPNRKVFALRKSAKLCHPGLRSPKVGLYDTLMLIILNDI